MEDSKDTFVRADHLTRFKPGQVANPKGRPKGSRNVLGEAFVAALALDFAEFGPDAICLVREEKPDVYLQVISRIIPKHIDVKADIEMHINVVSYADNPAPQLDTEGVPAPRVIDATSERD